MKLNSLMSNLLLSLLFLPHPAQADISQADAQNRLKALGKVMREEGATKTFTIINTHSAENSTSPDSKDVMGLSDIAEALNSEGGASLFCVKNNMLVASTLHPGLANNTLDVMAIEDDSGEKPFVKMKEALSTSEEAIIGVTNVFPYITDATKHKPLVTKHKPLATKHAALVASRRNLIGNEEADRNPGEKFYCGITNVRDN